MTKTQQLLTIAKEIETCKLCKKNAIGKAVPGEGDPDAEIMFIGEAPGKQEAKVGRPFIGRSGKLLRTMIKEIGLAEDGVYITSPVKYLPSYGTPKVADIVHGRKHLNEQIAVIDPKFIVLLGSVASQAVLEEKIPVKTAHGQIIKRMGRTYFITVHPAAALRFVPFRKLLSEDFTRLKKLVYEEKT